MHAEKIHGVFENGQAKIERLFHSGILGSLRFILFRHLGIMGNFETHTLLSCLL